MRSTGLLLALVIFPLVLAGQQDSQKHSDTQSNVKVTLRADKSTYQSADTLNLKVEVQNVGENPVWISTELAINSSVGCRPGGIWIEASDATGKPVRGSYLAIGDCAAPVGEPELVRLAKDQFFGVAGTQSLNQVVPARGQFTLVAHYVGPILNKLPSRTSQVVPTKFVNHDVPSAPIVVRVVAPKPR